MHPKNSRGSDCWIPPLPHILISFSPKSKLRLVMQGKGARGTILPPIRAYPYKFRLKKGLKLYIFSSPNTKFKQRGIAPLHHPKS